MKAIKVICPNDNKAEREYIIKIVLNDFLGLKYNLFFDNECSTYVLQYANENLPSNVKFLHNDLLSKPLPIIYGYDKLLIESNTIKCGLDIFASSFFMLTRWEEFVIKKRNKLGRVDESELWTVKNNLFNRPIVNEYCDFLEILLKNIGVNIIKQNKHFEVLLTHDVDWCYLSSLKKLFENIKKMIFKQKMIKKPLLIMIRYFYYKITKTEPFNSFDELMDKSDEYGFKNHFYFKATADGENGHTYSVEDSKVKKIIGNVIHRGHKIGLHPSENTIDNYEQFKEESKRLKRVANTEVNGGRNHGLYYNHNMYHYWEKEEYEYDSGLGFQFLNGFRSGTCYSYKIFDIYKRETLELREIPFIAMDSVAIRNKLKPHEFYNDVIKLIDIVKKYNGIICINGHSNMINMIEMKKYKKVYYDIVDYLGELDGIQ